MTYSVSSRLAINNGVAVCSLIAAGARIRLDRDLRSQAFAGLRLQQARKRQSVGAIIGADVDPVAHAIRGPGVRRRQAVGQVEALRVLDQGFASGDDDPRVTPGDARDIHEDVGARVAAQVSEMERTLDALGAAQPESDVGKDLVKSEKLRAYESFVY